MKNITEYIKESIVNEAIYDENMSNFIKRHNISQQDAEYFNKYYIEDPKKFFGKYAAGFDEFYASTLELLMYLAACLIDDDLPAKDYNTLGESGYRGIFNPYKISWFDEEDSNGNTVLECIQKWIDDNYSEFNKMYKMCKKYKISNNDVWDFTEKL